MIKARIATTLVLSLMVGRVLSAPNKVYCQAEDAQFDKTRITVIQHQDNKRRHNVALKDKELARTPSDGAQPDLTFKVQELTPGTYKLITLADLDSAGVAMMNKARSKHESLFAYVQIDQDRPTKRVVFVPWKAHGRCKQRLGIFDITNASPTIKLWLPPHVQLDWLGIEQYVPPKVPDAAVDYIPTVKPPLSHPRLWVSESTLPQIRANLTHPDHVKMWESVQKLAASKLQVEFPDNAEMAHNRNLEKISVAKAFDYLMTGNESNGKEAVHLMCEYMSRVSFGNLLDITREMGAAIYSAALVYDWCHALCSAEELEVLSEHMMRLAREMECQWPPFGNTIVNGHGNEAMVNRDLLAMSIALHDVDPEPYKYCAYKVLEELVPMRRFEYQSPRHNQGVKYAAYRFQWEMQAAWMMRLMAGREVFDPNIKSLPLYWLYMRIPNGELLRDGDSIAHGPYFTYEQTAMLCYTYSADPLIKGEFQRQRFRNVDPQLFLILDDPSIKSEPDLNKLPLTIDFGPIVSGMIARTDWNSGTNANNTVVAEIKGGGYHFGGHKHPDAGALQLYYRGLQIADLGQYRFSGTPYHNNFNKRSIAHSMLLVFDPDEDFKYHAAKANDGGSRLITRMPRTPKQVQEDPTYHYGKKLACSFGPSSIRPLFSYFSADLRSAYSDKIKALTRSFCFLKMNSASTPACVIVLDDIHTADATFKKYWQVNTLQPPLPTTEGVQLHNSENGVTGRVNICMLRPAPEEWTREIKSGDEVFNVFGYKVTSPVPAQPEANGHRILFSPRNARVHDTFLALMQIHADGVKPIPYTLEEQTEYVTIKTGEWIVCMARDGKLIKKDFKITVPDDKKSYQVVLAGVTEGEWQIKSAEGLQEQNSIKGGHTLYLTASAGQCQFIAPGTAR